MTFAGKYLTKIFTSLKSHLPHYHTCEANQPRAVLRHGRLFYAHVHTVQSYMINFPGKMSSSRSSMISFKPFKCNFLNTLFYYQKKHVLVVHFQHWISSYLGMHTEKMEKQPKTINTLWRRPLHLTYTSVKHVTASVRMPLCTILEYLMCTRS